MPKYSPVCDPIKELGAIPACSSASQDISTRSRCCGSMAWASYWVIPSPAVSNPPIWSKNPPHRDTVLPGIPGCGSYTSATSQRSGGTSRTALPPDSSKSHSASGESTPPANRQPTPTIAMGDTVLGVPAPGGVTLSATRLLALLLMVRSLSRGG
ncbi:Uncharacterised protein [Mycobacteroides abscessus subsp. massiliense]|nr:Uncharacterised protein [Mycobacteroides abscessus subsp. massiliense]